MKKVLSILALMVISAVMLFARGKKELVNAGNVLEYLSATLVMAFILGFLLQNIRYSRYPENIF